ncbi:MULTISPECIES: acetolactate synthase large subunit [unclassified Mesorhizobium]|uniref:acetolactate synthase large subunit n=1 Tax=unclassified Mesorhizobium TaxID=325217 RepID=UPI000F764144|nr:MULTISPECIES: acetolactate synthase large subunit [unclassified Mesorhizobium]TGT63623.1 acetolactate synthase large subunit [Mesorhizobium sp. M00.F.Ca.ET.170.01.1.1]AZO11291.1 acetolactate synthase large subunit [Mesorhizobium sp. M3A.F.Ca.ET.080.04.2.1]RWB76609.1 MAG: acetolactate synthase large subunit [Mesorhizobium sp.]RWB92214.1 MAG: acetolactate synthase large subunit [Mesorhizobium sp.]RWE27974.1 MAG: acetolactate synthase large subunit [Mesorhizobium sp.]
MNGADVLCDVLLANGVNVCFANPGTSEMHFVAALDRKPEMRCVLGLFEGVVTGAADGYARMTDRPAATLLHTGPGLANGLANIHNARRARVPMINIVGDHASYHLPLDAPLTSDIESLAAPMSNWVRRIAGPADVAPAAQAAFRASLTPPGTATLILPADAAWGEASVVSSAKVELAPPPAVDMNTVRNVAEAIRAAPGRVGMILRGPAARADGLEIAGQIAAAMDVRLFSEVLVARMQRGRGRVAPARIPYPIDAARAFLADIDVLILVGAKEPVAFFAYPGKPGRLVREGCAVMSLAEHGQDLETALALLRDELGIKPSQPVAAATAFPDEPTPRGKLTDDAIALSVARRLPDNAIVCDEAVTSARRYFALSAFAAQHDYMMTTGGSIGEGMPMATGAAIACPGRKVVNLEADGSGMYTVQALWTQAREKLDVVTIVFSNRTYAILHGEMRNVGVNAIGENARRMLDLDQPALDWVSLANGMGVEAARADTCERFDALLDSALSRPGPFLIEAVI